VIGSEWRKAYPSLHARGAIKNPSNNSSKAIIDVYFHYSHKILLLREAAG
jgi:hypothetical protein